MSKDAIKQRLVDDLHNGGPIFGDFRSQFKSIGERAIENGSQVTHNAVYSEALGDSQLYLWVLDPRVENHCDDCLERAEWEPKTMQEWEDLGLPGSGVTVCTTHCYCNLEPEGNATPDTP